MIVGIGIDSSFENGLLLHWIHGVPYVNGEAVKGAARSYAQEKLQNEEEKEQFRKIFGTLDKEEHDQSEMQKGVVTFFDAYPLPGDELFSIDVVTSHYLPYYENGETPGDWHMPKPVSFLTVAADVQFEFAVASESRELARKAWEWLGKALVLRGMGAKKRSGYGHFKERSSDGDCTGDVGAAALAKFREELTNVNPTHLAGRAAQLVESVEKIDDPEARVSAAVLLRDRLGAILKKKKESSWAKKLNSLLEGVSS